MKKFTVSALALLLCLQMTGCGEEKIPAVSLEPTARTCLNVVTSYGGDDGNHRHYQEALASFQKQYGVKIADNSSVSNEEWKNEVMTDFMTGSEPDVLFYFMDADADPFINANKVVSIEEIQNSYPDYATNMVESMIRTAEDGNHYAVPSTGYWETLFVNERVLEACGVEMPGADYTWEEFLEDCETIKKEGYIPIACSLFEIPHYWFEFMVMNHGSVQNHLDLPRLDEDGNLIRDDVAQKWIKGIEDIKMLYEKGYFPHNTLTATDAQTVSLFADAEAAFLIDGSWKLGFFTENYPGKLNDFKVSFVPGRGDRRATDGVGGVSMGYFITRKAWEDPEKRQAAVDFVTYMTSKEVLSTFVSTELTALKEDIDPVGLNAIQKSAAKAHEYVTGFSSAVQDSMSGEAKSELFLNIQKVVTGKMTAAQAVEKAIKLN